ncbi:neprilysin-2-like isoform X2 [Microplitis mediator]|uniref:neprilysin-2-like isoform X2 n=1 Tax=Microplitis mediator TaxID=375433 RepID=UPI00255225CF|nr:neprilysin-2-like isoform X2 [Microplitis mediator]
MENFNIKKLWVTSLAICISIITAENLNGIIKHSPGNELNCTTRECVKDNLIFELALLYNMDVSVDPCDNFYEFACGNFDNVPVDYLHPTSSYFAKSKLSLYYEIYNLLMRQNRVHSPKQLNFVKDFVTSCRNLNRNNNDEYPGIKKDKLDYLFEIISKLGGWPVIDGHEWSSTDFNWADLIYKSNSLGADSNHFMRLYHELNKRTRISLHVPDFEFSYKEIDNYQNSSIIDAYHKYMVDVAKFLGANETLAKTELMESLELELKLINISSNNNISSKNVDNTKGMSVKEIKEKWPSIKWEKLLTLEMEAQKKFCYSNESIIFIENHHYITELEKLMNETPKRVQANYAVWKTIQTLVRLVESITLHKLWFDYSTIRSPSAAYRDVNCFGSLENLLPDLLLFYYIRHHPIDERVKSYANQMIVDMKKKYLDTLNSTNRLDVKTKDKLTTETNSLKLIAGYPDEVLDDKILEEFYRGLEITDDNLLKNYLNLNFFREIKSSELIRNLNHSYTLLNLLKLLDPIDYVAYNFYNLNTIVLGIESLRNFDFSINRPDHINFGTLGTTIGHEIGHSIYESNNAVNKFGIKDNGWSILADKKFKETEECFIEQYSNYSYGVTGEKLNGSMYLQENIADNISIKVAYSVYRNWVRKNGPEPTYSSLPYNSNQLFWLSYANTYCTSKSSLNEVDSTDNHAPYDKRVNGPLSNAPEFSTDFKCPLGRNMNPVKKCSVF